MKLRILSVALIALLAVSCGGSSTGPGQIINPPPPTVVPPTGPVAPTPPGIGTNGKLSLFVEEGGSVTSSPDVGTCAGYGNCEVAVARGTVVTLTAVPNPGWVFEEWDRCTGPSGLQCVETIGALTYVKAEFDRAP
jgi:hypothetical protein